MLFLSGPRGRKRVTSGLFVILGPWLNCSVNWDWSPCCSYAAMALYSIFDWMTSMLLYWGRLYTGCDRYT